MDVLDDTGPYRTLSIVWFCKQGIVAWIRVRTGVSDWNKPGILEQVMRLYFASANLSREQVAGNNGRIDPSGIHDKELCDCVVRGEHHVDVILVQNVIELVEEVVFRDTGNPWDEVLKNVPTVTLDGRCSKQRDIHAIGQCIVELDSIDAFCGKY